MPTTTPNEKLCFDDLSLFEEIVSIKGEDYILREASEDAICRYRNHNIRAARMVDGRVVGMEDLADAEPLLVSLCLYTTNKEGKSHQQVALRTIRSWPHKVVKAIFARAKLISGLNDDKPTDKDKNSSSSSTDNDDSETNDGKGNSSQEDSTAKN